MPNNIKQRLRPAKVAAAMFGISVVWLTALGTPLTIAEESFDLRRLNDGGYAVMLRHALAPGIGDPSGFELADCSTQRNLDATGREQARRIGAQFRAAGVTRAAVYSSQWCRCLETARLLDLGSVSELPVLNSFYERPQDRDPNIQALRAFLKSLPIDGEPVFLVTHQVTISAITGSGAASGEAVILKLQSEGEPLAAGRTSNW